MLHLCFLWALFIVLFVSLKLYSSRSNSDSSLSYLKLVHVNMYKEIVDKTEDFFKDISHRKADNAVKWQLIKEFLLLNRRKIAALCSPFDMANSEKFCNILLHAMEDLTCDDQMLINSLTYLITLVHLKLSDCIEDFYCTRGRYALHIIESIAHKTGVCIFPDKGLNLLIALRGHYKFMKILLKYGLIISLPGDSDILRKMTTEIIRNLIVVCSANEENEDEEEYSEMTNEIIKMSEYYFFRSKTAGSIKRIFFAALGVQAIVYMVTESPLLTDYVKCLTIYFSAISDTFITIVEIKRLLTACFKCLNRMDLLGVFCEIYRELMPESSKKYQPRKLTELSRTQARHYLRSYSALPLAIENVILPKRLKSFIRCDLSEEADISGKNKSEYVEDFL